MVRDAISCFAYSYSPESQTRPMILIPPAARYGDDSGWRGIDSVCRLGICSSLRSVRGKFRSGIRGIGRDDFLQHLPQRLLRVFQYKKDHAEDTRAVQVCQIRGVGDCFSLIGYKIGIQIRF